MREWEPGRRLVYTWRQAGWPPEATTDVEVRFEPTERGTRVAVEHSGWERVPDGESWAEGYSHGLRELLGSFAEAVR